MAHPTCTFFSFFSFHFSLFFFRFLFSFFGFFLLFLFSLFSFLFSLLFLFPPITFRLSFRLFSPCLFLVFGLGAGFCVGCGGLEQQNGEERLDLDWM